MAVFPICREAFMGSDDLFKKRKIRRQKNLARREALRQTRDRILIACEGEKTEPIYFQSLCDDLRLSTADVKICGRECGSDPLSVVDFVLTERRRNHYDRTFCVVDRDEHASWDRALDKACQNQIEIISSNPCFEFWFLLHFCYTTRPYARKQNRSPADQVIEELKFYFPEYEKRTNIYRDLREKIDQARSRARKLQNYHKTSRTSMPSTRVHHLVGVLKKITDR